MQDEMKHTRGPWWVEDEGDRLVIVGPRENCKRHGVSPAWAICEIDNECFWDDPKTEAEDRACARLIAAAPEMAAFAADDQWDVVMGALDKWSNDGGSDLVALGIIGQGLLVLDEKRRAALSAATGRGE